MQKTEYILYDKLMKCKALIYIKIYKIIIYIFFILYVIYQETMKQDKCG